MALRNFWIEAAIDGRRTELTGGPVNRHGGLTATIYQRKDGAKETAVKIRCYEEDGQLFTRVDIGGTLAGVFKTDR